MNIREIHKNWTELGAADPMWAILTDPEAKGNRWDEDKFFRTGREQIANIVNKLRRDDVTLNFGKALDFGCGVGRLSQALADYFSAVDGVDVSSSMIDKARELNKHSGKVRYHLNVQADLQSFASDQFDFVYSAICLQHIPAHLQERYISEFIRILKPGGITWFQTIRSRGWRRLVPNSLVEGIRKLKYRGRAYIPMNGITLRQVQRAIASQKGILREHFHEPYKGSETRFIYDAYLGVKSD